MEELRCNRWFESSVVNDAKQSELSNHFIHIATRCS